MKAKRIELRDATHVYVGRRACGCVVTVITDTQDKETGREVGSCIAEGQTIERVTFDDYRTRVCNEPGFLLHNCPHSPPTVKQPELGPLFPETA